MSVDPQIIEAISGIVRAGSSHHRLCLIGGQALRDVFAERAYLFGDGVPPVRASSDVDLLVSTGTDPQTLPDFHSALKAEWDQEDHKPGTYQWRRDPSIKLDLVVPFKGQHRSAFCIRRGPGMPIHAYRVIPDWLHRMGLTERCHAAELDRLGLHRLRQGSLLISKVLAVHVVLGWVIDGIQHEERKRLQRDLEDIIALTHRSIIDRVWCHACQAQRPAIQANLREVRERIERAAADAVLELAPAERESLSQVADSLPIWWP